jgi:predicted nucleic acid-binding protein
MKHDVFVDTVAWLALINKSEILHAAARQVRDSLMQQKARLFTSDYVVVEVANALARIPFRSAAVRLVDFIRSSGTVDVLLITPSVFEEAWDFYKARTDKDWSLTDCTSFVVMKSRGIERAFTADRHFEQAGFTVLIRAK